MLIALHKGTSLVSRLIRWQTRSPYSHASLIFNDGTMVEAREGHGVLWHRSARVAIGNTKVDLFELRRGASAKQRAAMTEFLKDQLGKDYDYLMVARFLSRRQESRKTRGKWFCSELVFAAIQKLGVNLFDRTEPWEVSPGMLARSTLLRKVQRTL